MQIMDDGHLTDSAGRKVDFRNTVIVMTSNVGAKAITDGRQPLGFAGTEAGKEADMRRRVMEELRETFRPEFLNRIDETIVFHRLSQENMVEITRGMLRQVKARFQELGLALSVPEETVKWLAAAGYDDKFGARPLRRAVQQSIEDAAAEMLLDGEVFPGCMLTALVRQDKVELTTEE